jgi:hypothetical protein
MEGPFHEIFMACKQVNGSRSLLPHPGEFWKGNLAPLFRIGGFEILVNVLIPRMEVVETMGNGSVHFPYSAKYFDSCVALHVGGWIDIYPTSRYEIRWSKRRQ